MAISPDETDPPLVVDADRMLPAAIALQRLETIGGRNAKIGKALRRIEQTQLAQGDSLNVSGKVPAAEIVAVSLSRKLAIILVHNA
jgi:hypothetical protein